METTAGTLCKRSLGRSNTSSFRLRSPSLNSLRLRRIFDLFDKNNDGVITVNELSQALNLLGLDAELSELETLVNSHIKEGNTGLQFDDFESLHRSLNDTFFGFDDALPEEEEGGDVAAAAEAKAKQEESDLNEAFKVFDEDGDGYISARELQVVLGKLGLAEAREMDRVERMILSVDRNNDGRVDFFEFKDMMRSVMVRSA
ncbi:calcium-binding allergen Bet v 3 [Camellia sinensis]|uniref:EF-hand domain-containing protein n=1 Tax=Camellia sinensis var. sinensis TaxID=542762 RepID=A0A4S4E5B7_CAMSN|nr:calcium-binding allergen Bet v 3 [Camellia sinensis]THG11143.1 hypothetical protein TEA_016386 [Camellia sinensis var. sinensis]